MSLLYNHILLKIQGKIQGSVQAHCIARAGAQIKGIFSFFQDPGTPADFAEVIKGSKFGNRDTKTDYRCLTGLEEGCLAEGFQFPGGLTELSTGSAAVELNDFFAGKTADISDLCQNFDRRGVIPMKNRPR